MWRDTFDFGITIGYNKPRTLQFRDRNELIAFLKEHGVRLDDANNPLEILGPREHNVLGSVYDVVQFSCIGWIKDEYV